METLIGVVLGAIATVIASHYYYRRTISKSLGIYRLLSTSVLSGIAPDVRSNLNFRFNGVEVHELQQLIFLVANDGQRSIRDVLEPLTMSIPSEVGILDATIVYRSPDTLQAKLGIKTVDLNTSTITLDFPLLNKGEFFVVKMLLSGNLSSRSLKFSMLSDDLPRTIALRPMPPGAFDERWLKFEWGLALAAAVVLLFPAWVCYFGYKLLKLRPDLSPMPWSGFHFSVEAAAFIIPAVVAVLLLGLLGFMMMGAAIFGGEFPPRRGPRFPLPKDLRVAVFPYRRLHAMPLELEDAIDGDPPDAKPKKIGNT